jgi:hypothetical protein
LLVAAFHTKPTSNLSVDTVVVGKAAVDASNDAPQVIALAAVPTLEIVVVVVFGRDVIAAMTAFAVVDC